MVFANLSNLVYVEVCKTVKNVVATLVLLVACACLIFAFSPAKAYADPTYTMSVVSKDAIANGNSSYTVAPGDTFTVSLMLESTEGASYTMYAMSTTLRYSASMLEVVSIETNNDIVGHTTSANNGYQTAVFNYMSTSFGTTWDSSVPLANITFKALKEGNAAITFQRVNICNKTGSKSFDCTCKNASFESTYDIPVTAALSVPNTCKDPKFGEEFYVNVTTDNIPVAMNGTFKYSDNLTLVSIESGSALSGKDITFNYEQGSPTFSYSTNAAETDESGGTGAESGLNELTASSVESVDVVAAYSAMAAAAGVENGCATASAIATAIGVENGGATLATSAMAAAEDDDDATAGTGGTATTDENVVVVAKFKCTGVGPMSVSLESANATATTHSKSTELNIEQVQESIDLNAPSGDVNNSSAVNVVDAQIVYDMTNGVYDETDMRNLLLNVWKEQGAVTYEMIESVANVNADDQVDAADAYAILYFVVNGTFNS
jgi:hypothetical protein